MPLQNCISIVIDEYNIHFDDSYCKYHVIADPKEVNFSRGSILPIPAVLLVQEHKTHQILHEKTINYVLSDSFNQIISNQMF